MHLYTHPYVHPYMHPYMYPYTPLCSPLHTSYVHPMCTPTCTIMHMPMHFPMQPLHTPLHLPLCAPLQSDWLRVLTTTNQTIFFEKPNYHKILIFFPTTSWKRLCAARIDELADSNKPAITEPRLVTLSVSLHTQTGLHCLTIQVLNIKSLLPKY